MTHSEPILLRSVKVLHDGVIEVEREEQVVRLADNAVVSSRVVTQRIEPAQDLSELALEPVVLAIAAAVCEPAQLAKAQAEMLKSRRVAHEQLLAEQQQQLQELETNRANCAAATQALEAEQLVLNGRRARLEADRQAMAARREAVRREHIELQALGVTGKLGGARV